MAAKTPEKEWTSGICAEILKTRQRQTTPDFLQRKLEGDQLVFVYGHEMSGNKSNVIFHDSKYLGKAVTHATEFVMMENRTEDFPVVFTKKGTPMVSPHTQPAKVKGELYLIDPLTLLELDDLLANEYLHKRVQRHVKCLDQKYPLKGDRFAHPFAKVWIYLGVPECWRSLTHLGSKFNSPQLDWHYSFSSTKTRKVSTYHSVYTPHQEFLTQMSILDDKIPW